MKPIKTTSFFLHLLAMAFMLCDHLWATVVPGNIWLTCVGRLAFPIFAFLLVEGFFRTHSRKQYALRLLLFALLSEIPFNLMYGSSLIYPFHQNVLWTFLIAMGCMELIERAKGKWWRWALTSASAVFAGMLLGTVLMTDYFGFGVLTVLVFYFFRGQKWYCYAGQLIGMFYVNCILLAGLEYPVSLLGLSFAVPQQGIALLALLPIWLYSGRRGYHSKLVQYLFYAFYPVHMLILAAAFMMK